MQSTFIEELKARGLVYQNSPGIESALEQGTTMYLGYDPTGPDLHIGHLLGITLLKRALEHGQKIIVLVGGGTSMIGDPGGKDAERPILAKEQIEANKEQMKEQFSHFFTFDDNKVRMVDNADWLTEVKLIDFLRDAGKHISINTMIDKDSVASRITREEGISYAEFSYQLMQAYDFVQLYQKYDCKVQVGGSDQWGNIIQGVELIRKRLQQQAFALSYPLITNPKTGKKFGKTESGEGIWLNPEKTHPFMFYQFLLNTEDELAPTLMRYFSFKPVSEIEELITQWEGAKHERLLQKELAFEVTAMVHGVEAANRAVEMTHTVFQVNPAEWTHEQVEEVYKAIGKGTIDDINMVQLTPAPVAVAAGVASSLSEARRLLDQKGITLLPVMENSYVVIKKGKKHVGMVKVERK